MALPSYVDGQEQPLSAQDQMVLEGDPTAVTSVQNLMSMAAVEPEKIYSTEHYHNVNLNILPICLE